MNLAERVRLAQDAMARGQQALAAGDAATAMPWLDRACRLAPSDRTLTLNLATACLTEAPARAAALFAGVAAVDDVREAWLGLAAARLRLNRPAEAAAALAAALQRHVVEPSVLAPGVGLAQGIAAASGAPGWCGVSADGAVSVHVAAAGEVSVRLDGRPCRGATLPAGWQRAKSLTVQSRGRDLLGSPIDIAAIRRCVGFVEAHAGGVRGWAWHPGDPDTPPTLEIRTGHGRVSLRITADQPADGVQWTGALARPRAFLVPADALAGLRGPLHVIGRDGRDLLGSPLDPAAESRATAGAAAALARLYPAERATARPLPLTPPSAMPADVAGPPARRALPRRRPVTVVIPVHDGAEVVLACLDTVCSTVRQPNQILVVDDGSTDPALVRHLDALASGGRIRLLRHGRNRGFPAAANSGIAAAAGHDIVLLNSDTLVPPGWLERLRAAARHAPDIGTATPLSNSATILSYPDAAERNPVPDLAGTIALDTLAQRANPDEVVEIPVGVGFCLFIRRDCLADVGLLRADVFAQGYGEENDFCLRARHLGWRHVAVPGLFVAHCGGASFGSAGKHLQLRNEALLNRLHPGYAALIHEFVLRDPLAEPRRRLDLLRWRGRRRRGQEAVIVVSHADGGGVERQIAAAAQAHRAAGFRPVVLRPRLLPDGARAICVGEDSGDAFPNLSFAMPDELPALLRLLRAERPHRLELHHLLGHDPAIHALIARLAVPYDVHVHDYAWFCPRVSLVGAERRYCGEPDTVRCEACVADAGALIEETIGVQALRDRSASLLAGAARVVAPAADVAGRMRRHFPGLAVQVVPHEDDDTVPDPPATVARNGRCRVCVLGAIGLHKGYDVLLACARDADERRLPLEIVVVGHTIDDARLLATGRVFITGEYARDEAVGLIAAQQASLGFLPSIWPETWSLGLTELWRGGLRVVAFDFGAPAERIRRTGRGFLLPVGLPPPGINNALVAAVRLSGHKGR